MATARTHALREVAEARLQTALSQMEALETTVRSIKSLLWSALLALDNLPPAPKNRGERREQSLRRTGKQATSSQTRAAATTAADRGGYAFSEKDRATGGKARAAALTAKQRSDSARKAVKARWARRKKQKTR